MTHFLRCRLSNFKRAFRNRSSDNALPGFGYKRSIALAGRDTGKRCPGLRQCSNGDCRFQFTVTRLSISQSCLCVSG